MAVIDIPETLPVMVLPNCSLFPEGRLPLFIFEPRYRQMLADVLAGDRMFCVGTVLGENPDTDLAPVDPFSTAALVRACVENEDGTANLILQGLRRVQFTGWLDAEPYRVAQVRPVLTIDPDPDESGRLCAEIKVLAEGRLRRAGFESDETVETLWENLQSDEQVADFVAYHLVPDVARRQPMLAMQSVTERLGFLKACLTEA